jgi:signal transduction histidine kinase
LGSNAHPKAIPARQGSSRTRADSRARRFFAGIQARLVIVLLLASLPALGIFGSYVAYRYKAEKTAAIQELQQQARSIASSRGILLDQTEALLRSLASLPQLRNMSRDPGACGEVLVQVLQGAPQYANIAAADMEGRVLCRGIAVAPQQPIHVTDRAWFQRVVARQDFVVGNYTVGRGSGQASVHTAYPIFDDQHKMIGAVNAGIHLSWLKERFAAVNLPPGMVVALLDSDGTLLIRHPDPERLTGRKGPNLAPLIAEKGGGVAQLTMLDGVDRMVAFEPLGETRWSDLTVYVAEEPSYLWNPVWRLIGEQTAMFVMVLLLGILAAVAGAHWMVVRPVRLLQRAVDAYASGNRSARASAQTRDEGEIGRLARAFNAMAETLNHQEKALRKANAVKSRYLTIASHDFRQPLQVTMLGLEMALRTTDGKVRASLERAQRAAERLHGQLDLLADVVRADLLGVDAQSQIRAVSVSELFKDVEAAHAHSAAAKGLRLRFVSSKLQIASDPGALASIVNNLVLNAINYTSEGRVLVGCRKRSGKCRIEIHDTGSGIAPEHLERIFEAFHRVQPTAGTGLGLGLTIVKETASSLGHRILVHSKPGKGSCFCVEVPLWKESNR